jgi:hypothetical protein
MTEISANELDSFLKQAKVDTRNTLFSDGRITQRHEPVQVTYRLPSAQAKFINNAVEGNKNYAVSKILEFGIKKLKEQLTQGDFNIDDLKDL